MLVRRSTTLALLLLAAVSVSLSVSGCAAGKPPLFSEGTSWSFPVVVDEGFMLAPVYIGDKGPYMFAVAPGLMAAIDPSLVKELDLYNFASNTSLLDSSDVVSTAQVRLAEVTGFRVGDLELRTHRLAIIEQKGTYNGVPVRGIIGSDVFDDTAVWTLDRDRRMVYLTVQEQFVPPAEAPVEFRVRGGSMFARAEANGTEVELEVELFQPGTLFFPWAVDNAGLESRGGDRLVVDTLEFKNGTVARDLAAFAFNDKRVRPNTLDGRLGSDFFSDYRVTVNMHQGKIWLEERPGLDATRGDRIRRWGSALGCPDGECASARLTGEEGAATLEVNRSSGAGNEGLELLFAAYDERGERNDRLPPISATLPRDVSSLQTRSSQLQRYLDYELRIIDITPFPADCGMPDEGCARLSR